MQIVLDSYGAFLGVANGMFSISIRGGQTHTVAVRKVKSILVQKGASMSANAVILALENDVQLVFTDGIGRPVGQLWNSRFGSIGTIRKHQALFCQHPKGAHWAVGQVQRKIRYQLAFLQQLAHTLPEIRPAAERAYKVGERIGERLKALPLDPLLDAMQIAPSLRGWEGTVARQYFRVLSQALSPGYRFGERSRQPAKDWFNCVLNYLYGMLYTQIERALITAGVDPQLGVLHADQYNKPVMVYDFIEPYRIWAERIAFYLFQGHRLYESCFQPQGKKGIWLGREGKGIVIDAYHAYMQEAEVIDTKSYSRNGHLTRAAQQLAQQLLYFHPT